MNDILPSRVAEPRLSACLRWLGLLLVAVSSLTPLVLIVAARQLWPGWTVDFIAPHTSALADWGSKAIVLFLMGLALAVRAWADRREEPFAGRLTALFGLLAAVMLGFHWCLVDSREGNEEWQRELYLDILNFRASVPHVFRALPYGFTRGLEWFTGDWLFSCLAYRWFFTFWFVWGCYQFARRFHAWPRALATLAPLVVLYPFSVLYYCGQLTDPLSHALFVLALIYVVEDRALPLAAALALGILAKETVVLVVPAYWACYWRRGSSAFLKTAGLTLACVAAFLVARLPLGWQLNYQKINGTEELMIPYNLGIGGELYRSVAHPVFNYLHPLAFVGTFVPFIMWKWRWIDWRLKALCVTLTPLLLASNLCFGWMYESRNYVPLLPLLATMALWPSVVRGQWSARNDKSLTTDY